jgi:hypothetical protein
MSSEAIGHEFAVGADAPDVWDVEDGAVVGFGGFGAGEVGFYAGALDCDVFACWGAPARCYSDELEAIFMPM